LKNSPAGNIYIIFMGYELKSNKISLPRWQQRMAAAVRLRYGAGFWFTTHDYRVRQFLYCTVVYRLPHRRQHLRSQQQLWVSATTQVLAGCNFFIGSRTTMQVSATSQVAAQEATSR
jgi:hypothetical protein